MNRLHHRKVMLIAAAFLTAVLVGGWWWRSTSGVPEPESAPLPGRLTQTQAEEVAANLTSGDLARFRRAVAVPSGQAIDPKAITQLAGLKVTLDASTFKLGVGKIATVRGTVTGGPNAPGGRMFVLVATADGRWAIVDTIESA